MSATKPNRGLKPRNSIFVALKQRLLKGGGAGRHQGGRAGDRHKREQDKDLADRIREVGEW